MAVKVTVERNYKFMDDKPTTVRIEGDTVVEVSTAVKEIEILLINEATSNSGV